MTLREIYLELRKTYLRGEKIKFPVYINLRDHHGQSNPAEVLERHARNIGFPHPSHLVRAWRAGYVILLLDGFDEITSIGWVGVWKKLHEARYRSMTVIRQFIHDTPFNTGLILAGRAYFFDGETERSRALAINSNFLELNLSDFTDEQVENYLDKQGFKGKIPAWIPSRPLLLGTLVARGVLEGIVETHADAESKVVDPAEGWEILIKQIANREAKIEIGIDGETLRRIFERLATKARSTTDGLGPLTQDQIISAFEETCGYQPDEQGMLLLQRLPSLGIDQEGEQTRKFIDEDLVDVCRAGDVVEFINNPYAVDPKLFAEAEIAMLQLGISVAVKRLVERKVSEGEFNSALERIASIYEVSLLAADIVKIAIELGWNIRSKVYIRNVLTTAIELTSQMGNVSLVEFQDCYFKRIELDNNLVVENLPKFHRCYFSEVDGRTSTQGLPESKFINCEFDKFLQNTETSKAILDLNIPIGTRVLLTVLRKLFIQRGSGRRETALYRGLDHRARRLVPDVLRLLKTEDIISSYPRGSETIWLPNRTQYVRVHKMISNPRDSSDLVLAKSRDLS